MYIYIVEVTMCRMFLLAQITERSSFTFHYLAHIMHSV